MSTGKKEGVQIEKCEMELEDLIPTIRGIAKLLVLREELALESRIRAATEIHVSV